MRVEYLNGSISADLAEIRVQDLGIPHRDAGGGFWWGYLGGPRRDAGGVSRREYIGGPGWCISADLAKNRVQYLGVEMCIGIAFFNIIKMYLCFIRSCACCL